MFYGSVFSATLLALAVFTWAMIPTTMAWPAAPAIPLTLLITSNIEPGIEYDGGMGPFIIGKSLTITCSTTKSKALSWWEGDSQLPTFVKFEKGISSCNFIVGTLKSEDSRRHFTCRELVSGTEKSVDLHLVNDDMKIQKGGLPLKNEQTVVVFAGTNFSLDCIVYGSYPSTGSWWEGETNLPSKRTTSPNVIYTQLTLSPARYEDYGRELTCRARNGQLTKSVVLKVVEESLEIMCGEQILQDEQILNVLSREESNPICDGLERNLHAPQSPTVTSKATSRTKSSSTTGAKECATTSTPDGPVSETVSNANSGAATTSANHQEINEMKSYLIAVGVVIILFGIVLTILLYTLLNVHIRKNKLDSFTSQQQGNFCEKRALEPRPVEGGNETASSGRKMSAIMPDDRDHSYYYPDVQTLLRTVNKGKVAYLRSVDNSDQC